MRWRLLVCVLGVAALAAGSVSAQNDRRDRQDPELIIESGGRMGACDRLAFTADGKQLLAVGDDKVIRVWDWQGDKLAPHSVLRWSIWRERRGAIYGLALTPGRAGQPPLAAIGGFGVPTGTVAVLDRESGRILHTASPTSTDTNAIVTALAFAPTGNRLAYSKGDGSIWLWDFRTGKPRRLSPKVTQGGANQSYNWVRLVHFLNEQEVLSVGENGAVIKWDLTGDPPPGTLLSVVRGDNFRTLHCAALSPDGTWLAAGAKGPVVALRSVDGTQKKDIELRQGEFPRSVAFAPDGKQLAVSIGSLMPGTRFYLENDDRIRLYSLDTGAEEQPALVGEFKHRYHADYLAYHPRGDQLAIAGGDNHEVTLWDISHPDRPTRLGPPQRGSGSCLWDVALSANGRYLGFRDTRDNKSIDPNQRGAGPWRAFDLPGRQWVEAQDFKPIRQLREAGGWHVEPDRASAYRWYAVDSSGTRYALPHNGDTLGMPRCYCFLPARAGQPVRLAVGHYWGLSLYELSADGVRRTRLYSGHQGEVTALAISADGKWLVSASNDETVAAWSLADWPSQAELGARFAVVGRRLRVQTVDVGSPAWEAGLMEGDEIVRWKLAAVTVPGGPEDWLDRLRHPEPGKEHYFYVRRGRRSLELLTTVRQRPLWRFFPMRDGEWVLWMWRNSFYDTSTKGDFAIGWHVNSPDLGHGTPAFYRAEQFRKQFERPDVIDQLLQTRDVPAALRLVSDNPVPQRFDTREPPAARLLLEQPAARGVTEEDALATLLITPHGDNPDNQPSRVELWVNDYRLLRDADVLSWEKRVDASRRVTYRRTVRIANSRLRSGKNVLTFQSYNPLGGRAEAVQTLECRRTPRKPRLLGLAVGINDYSGILSGGRRAFGDLECARADAEELSRSWDAQKGPFYANVDITMLVPPSGKADRADILRALDELAATVHADDRCVLFLSGHGLFKEERPGGPPPGRAEQPPRSVFVFCCQGFRLDHPFETGLTNTILYEKLAAIPCRKVVILDACHAGEAVANPVRHLTPEGQGPIIMAACDRNQSSYEDKALFGHGLFTKALLEALGDRFARADHNGDEYLDAAELFNYARSRLPELLRELKLGEYAQVPIMYAPHGDNYALARKRDSGTRTGRGPKPEAQAKGRVVLR